MPGLSCFFLSLDPKYLYYGFFCESENILKKNKFGLGGDNETDFLKSVQTHQVIDALSCERYFLVYFYQIFYKVYIRLITYELIHKIRYKNVNILLQNNSNENEITSENT